MENGPDNDIRTAHHSSPWEGGQERRKALPADHNKNMLFFFAFFVSTMFFFFCGKRTGATRLIAIGPYSAAGKHTFAHQRKIYPEEEYDSGNGKEFFEDLHTGSNVVSGG